MFDDYNPVTEPATLISMTQLGNNASPSPEILSLLDPPQTIIPHVIDHITLS